VLIESCQRRHSTNENKTREREREREREERDVFGIRRVRTQVLPHLSCHLCEFDESTPERTAYVCILLSDLISRISMLPSA
jgi:hypothetical protein